MDPGSSKGASHQCNIFWTGESHLVLVLGFCSPLEFQTEPQQLASRYYPLHGYGSISANANGFHPISPLSFIAGYVVGLYTFPYTNSAYNKLWMCYSLKEIPKTHFSLWYLLFLLGPLKGKAKRNLCAWECAHLFRQSITLLFSIDFTRFLCCCFFWFSVMIT